MSAIKYGHGALREVGNDVEERFGIARGSRVGVYTDAKQRHFPHLDTVLRSLKVCVHKLY